MNIIGGIYNEKERNIEEIIEIANLVGGITTTRLGALESIPNWNEVEKFI